MYLFLAFLLVPLIEIALFIQVGGAIGLWPTLAIVILTAMLGTSLVRAQGRSVIGRLQQSLSQLRDPTEPLADGAMILLAGAFLLTPGFFTDAVGLALMVPRVRRAVFRHLGARVRVHRFDTQPGAEFREPDAGDTIDGEFEEVRPKPRSDTGKSGWVQGPKRH